MIAAETIDLSKRFKKHRQKGFLTLKSKLIHGMFHRTNSREYFWALKDVSLKFKKGEMVGIIGRNGSGKTTLLKLLADIIKPTNGRVKLNGKVSALIELGAGFHPEISGRENVFINGVILGLTRNQVKERFNEIVHFAGLKDFIDHPVRTYSSGMYVRLGFAIAINVDPGILLIDEILSVGDEAFSHKCIEKINDFKRKGKTIILVTHDLGSVERLCDRAIWLDHGKLMAEGMPRRIIDQYRSEISLEEEANLALQHEQVQTGIEETQSIETLTGNIDFAKAHREEVPSNRWGSREAEITSIQFFDKDNNAKHVFETGEPLTIEIGYRTNSKIENPVFGIGLYLQNGTCCYGTNTNIEGIEIKEINNSGFIYLKIDSINLIEGKYYLDVAIHKVDGYPYDYHTRCYSFVVRSTIKDIGIYRPSHNWFFNDKIEYQKRSNHYNS
ncbi:MAG: hypothetical protein A2161_00025 [Candidatus Schekmanbacteria bacterium RBG_13_48_7]|uniref:ABC transporter domain-containing protein n=1 Tax=Candidatus Schekmanbacteria bacterium RBG_13_48_7 TaxID=1817878 RepID=A0A1F7S1F7_9BACT|nr:MAG: hypothetical protein A2161_00025 [Candidatus Schekmanbacteria bacterium RBG_13_48_7]